MKKERKNEEEEGKEKKAIGGGVGMKKKERRSREKAKKKKRKRKLMVTKSEWSQKVEEKTEKVLKSVFETQNTHFSRLKQVARASHQNTQS